jgi:DNA-binding transcriptional MerR regulator
MYSIGEFAAFGRVSPRMLRHYDAIGLLKPAHTDPSGYRRYGVWQLPDLYLIAELRDLGVGLPAIGRVFASSDADSALRSVLSERRTDLLASVDEDKRRLDRIDRQLSTIGVPPMNDRIEYTPVNELTVYAAHARAVGGGPERIGETIATLIPQLDAALEAAGRPMIEPGIFWYVPVEGSDDVEVHVSYMAEPETVPGPGYDVVRLPAAPMMARLRHHGDMTKINESWAALMTRIVADGYAMLSPSREVYVHAPGHVPGEDWVTELQVPVVART